MSGSHLDRRSDFCRSTSVSPHPRHAAAKKRARVAVVARFKRGFTARPEIAESLDLIPEMKDIDRKPFDLSQLKGKVVFAVNVASEDTSTDDNYTFLASLLEEHGDDGLVVLAFPCNWFGQKETKRNAEIKKFVHEKYSSQIILMDKSDPEENPVFALGMKHFPGEIFWNFHGKFLFSKAGQPIERFDLLSTDEHVARRVQAAMYA